MVTRRTIAVALLLCLTAVACATKINKVLADPSKYRDKEVKISGRVADSVSIVDRGAYRIVDSSGEIWVVSTKGVPRVGANVDVRGTIRDGYNFGLFGNKIRLPGGLSSGLVLIESSHSAR
jgi:membrane protein implicated in regulation of membrane protease activity